MNRTLLATRALAAGVTTVSALALIAILAGFRFPADALTGGPLLGPVDTLLFLLGGLCLWVCSTPPPPARLAFRRFLPLPIAVAGIIGLALDIGQPVPWIAPGAAACFVAWGLCMCLLDRSYRRLDLSQVLAVVLLWGSLISLLVRTYGVLPESSHGVHFLLSVPASFLFAMLTAGFLLARPDKMILAVLFSGFSGGLLARRILPLILIMPFTVGWIRLQGQLQGFYDMRFGFALFATTNVSIFAVFIWISARILNRIDAKRQTAFDSLREGNLELRRVNLELEALIAEQKTTEEARQRMERQLFQSQKMEAIGTLASGIAHDFNNILTVILLNAETVEEALAPEHHASESLREIRKSGTRAKDLIRQIMTFGRKDAGSGEPVRLDGVVTDAVTMLRHTLPSRVEIRTRLEAGIPRVLADATHIQQVLLNLGTNAVHAMPEGDGVLDIRVDAVSLTGRANGAADESHVRITVSDTGHGMDSETVKRIFDPFFTTKPPGKGTGLGLSVVHGIMKLHGGEITVSSSPGRGTVFSLYFPAIAGLATAETSPAPREPARGNGERILCVDDNESILSSIRRKLEPLGYNVTCCHGPRSALELFGADPSAFDLMLLDFSMPELSGPELAEVFLRARPGLSIVIMSGFLRPEDVAAAERAGARAVILKPDIYEKLGDTLRDVLEKYPVKQAQSERA